MQKFKISQIDEAFIREKIPEAVSFLDAGQLRELMEELNIVELKRGYDGPYEKGPNIFGRRIERLIDNLYYDNMEK